MDDRLISEVVFAWDRLCGLVYGYGLDIDREDFIFRGGEKVVKNSYVGG